MNSANCPECNQFIELESQPEIGQKIKCTNCSNMLEVTWLLPVLLDYLDDEKMTKGDTDDLVK